MPKRSSAIQPHHPYFDLLRARSLQRSLYRIDPVAEKILEFIALENYKGGHLTMMKALEYSKNLTLTQSTVARRIKVLQRMKLIEIRIDTSDRRMKILHLSEKATRHFHALSKLILNVHATNLHSI